MSKTLEVAERIMLSSQRNMWALADAVLDDVPAQHEGRPSRNWYVGVPVSDRINALSVELAEAGVTKTDGSVYQPSYLNEMRKAAMAWGKGERQAEASFEAHRENAGESRPVFLALCAVARGEKIARPTQCEPKAWKAALDKLTTQRYGFKVQTQAVRIAMSRPDKNAPTKLDGATFAELLRHLTVGLEGLQAFADRITDYEIDDDDRRSMVGVLSKLRDKASMTIDVLTASIDDDDLSALVGDGS